MAEDKSTNILDHFAALIWLYYHECVQSSITWRLLVFWVNNTNRPGSVHRDQPHHGPIWRLHDVVK